MDRPLCGVAGCGLPVLSSLDGTAWFHWVERPEDREVRYGNGPVQRYSRRGGHHAARPPDGFDIAAHVAAQRDLTLEGQRG